MEKNIFCEGLQESSHRYFSVVENRLRKECQEEDSFPRRPVLKLLWFRQVAVGGAKEEFYHQETDIFAISGEGALDVNQDHGYRLRGYFQSEVGDLFSKGLVSNGRMLVRYLDVPMRGYIGKYCQIW